MPNDVSTATPHLNIPPEFLKKLIDSAQIDDTTALRLINAVNGCKTMVELDSLVHNMELKRTEWGFNKPTCSYILEQVGKFGVPAAGFAASFYWYDSQQRSDKDPQARQGILHAREATIFGASFACLEAVVFGVTHRLNLLETRDFSQKKKFLELLLPFVKGEKKLSDYTDVPLKFETTYNFNGGRPQKVGLFSRCLRKVIILGDDDNASQDIASWHSLPQQYRSRA